MHATSPSMKPRPRRSARKLKRRSDAETGARPFPAETASSRKRIKGEAAHGRRSRRGGDDAGGPPARTAPDRAAALQARKLQSFAAHAGQSPFADWARPTPRQCRRAHGILARLHGDRVRPDAVVAPTAAAGCGNSPSVLDALVRTILSQNTSDANSSRAKRAMDAVYGGSDRWEAIVEGGQARLQSAIRSGGLSAVKSKVILGILHQAKARHGVYSLDHLFAASDADAMREMLSFQGVGPKTASCVLLFCLRRASFAVDTHVYRITGLLGWRPPAASREEAQAHLDARIPPEEKYPLHVLLISHGKKCAECRAGGKSLGRCELRRAFGRGRLGAEAVESETGDDEDEDDKTAIQDKGVVEAVQDEEVAKSIQDGEVKAVKDEQVEALGVNEVKAVKDEKN